jgi:hypothetical protein
VKVGGDAGADALGLGKVAHADAVGDRDAPGASARLPRTPAAPERRRDREGDGRQLARHAVAAHRPQVERVAPGPETGEVQPPLGDRRRPGPARADCVLKAELLARHDADPRVRDLEAVGTDRKAQRTDPCGPQLGDREHGTAGANLHDTHQRRLGGRAAGWSQAGDPGHGREPQVARVVPRRRHQGVVDQPARRVVVGEALRRGVEASTPRQCQPRSAEVSSVRHTTLSLADRRQWRS